jgi:hypothetical protein
MAQAACRAIIAGIRQKQERFGRHLPERIPFEWNGLRSISFFSGACSFRKTGVHFSGTCAKLP